MSTIYVVIESVRGSAPRDAGTAMAVTAQGTQGTIGGGALEHRAVARARALLNTGREAEDTHALGPGLGQCCGGSVRLRYTYAHHDVDAPQMPKPHRSATAQSPIDLWLWGAGHVGRAIVRHAPAHLCSITWADTAPSRFPEDVPPFATPLPAADLPRLALRTERQAAHFVFTYSHDIDLALCDALLRREVRSIGLIGSKTKWARFQKRLFEMGHKKDQIARITCPIGDKSLGKAPDAIARGVLSALGI